MDLSCPQISSKVGAPNGVSVPNVVTFYITKFRSWYGLSTVIVRLSLFHGFTH